MKDKYILFISLTKSHSDHTVVYSLMLSGQLLMLFEILLWKKTLFYEVPGTDIDDTVE